MKFLVRCKYEAQIVQINVTKNTEQLVTGSAKPNESSLANENEPAGQLGQCREIHSDLSMRTESMQQSTVRIYPIPRSMLKKAAW